MEVEAHEKKGHRAFAKAIKSFNSSERRMRSNRFVPKCLLDLQSSLAVL
jgi:hypothetical protein